MDGAGALFQRHEPDCTWEVDVFFDELAMCHLIDFASRLELGSPTLPVVDLVLAKLQIIELDEKDALDVCCLLANAVDENGDPGLPDLDRLVELARRDWGLFHTIELNLPKIASVAHAAGFPAPWRERTTRALDAIGAAIQAAPKTAKWRARSRIGARIRWYQLVEDARR
jgi:hypothetical protein